MSSLSTRKTSSFEESYSDRGTGSKIALSVWRPHLHSDEYRIVYVATNTRHYDQSVIVVKEGDSSDGKALKPPDYFECVYTDRSTGGVLDGSLWKPVPPKDYIALSDVAVHMSNTGLSPGVVRPPNEIDSRFRCVHRSLCLKTELSINNWTNKGSGGRYEGATWEIKDSPAMRASRGDSRRPRQEQYRLDGFVGKLYNDTGIVFLRENHNDGEEVSTAATKRLTLPYLQQHKNIATREFIFIEGTDVPMDVEIIHVHPSINVIQRRAFEKMESLLKVTIPSTVKVIGGFAFARCKGLREVILHNGLTEIQEAAFLFCESLKSIEIPGTVTKIGDAAFRYCTSLEGVTVPSSFQEMDIGLRAFLNCPKLTPTTIQIISDCFNKQRQQQIRIKEGPGPKHGFLGATQKGYSPEMWGISLQQIKDILNHPLIFDDTTMRQVVELVIKPATKDCGLGYALLINQAKPLHANIMVSHAWDEPILQFINCLEKSGKEGPFWVCAFAIYQNSGDRDKPTIGEQLGPNPEFGPFATVLRDAEGMIAVITTLCEIYTRLWCVFEMHVAKTLTKEVKLCPYIDGLDIRDGYLEKDVCIADIDKNVDSESAICGNSDDMHSIHRAILSVSENGFHTINRSVEEIRLAYLLNYHVDDVTDEEGNLESALKKLATSIKVAVSRVYICEEDSIPQFEYNDEDSKSAYKKWLVTIKKYLDSKNDLTIDYIK